MFSPNTGLEKDVGTVSDDNNPVPAVVPRLEKDEKDRVRSLSSVPLNILCTELR